MCTFIRRFYDYTGLKFGKIDKRNSWSEGKIKTSVVGADGRLDKNAIVFSGNDYFLLSKSQKSILSSSSALSLSISNIQLYPSCA